MIAVNGAVETFIDEKVRRRTLLTELGALPLFQFLKLFLRKTGIEEHVDGQSKPGIEIITQTRGTKHNLRGAKGPRSSESRTQAVDLFRDL